MRAMKVAFFIGIYLTWQTVCSKISSGCLSLVRPCVSSEFCRSQQIILRNMCGSEEGRCHTQDSELCNGTIQAILAHSASWRECVCPGEDTCSVLQLLTSLCLSYLAGEEALGAPDQLSVTTKHPSRQATAHRHKQLKPEWEASHLLGHVPGPNSSCLQEMTLCIEDEVCNRQLVPFVQSCTEPQCEKSQCRLATRHFFTSLPQNVAEMLAFCQCEQEDQDCQDVLKTLHSTSCSGVHMLPWNCLEMFDSCSEDELCRKKLEGFLSKCFGAEDVPFTGYSTRDLLHLIDLRFFLSGDKECRMSFVATMGSLLQSTCTCHGLHHDHLYRCNMLQQAFQNRSQFRLHGTKRNVTRMQLQIKKSNQSHLWFNDQLWFFLVYVFVAVVILIVVTVVLRKLGGMQSLSKERRFSPPEGSIKSLVP